MSADGKTSGTTLVDSTRLVNLDVAWMAGLLEGEGYFGFVKNRTRPPMPRVVLRMADRDVVERFGVLVGRSVSQLQLRQEGRKAIWSCTITGWRAVEICGLVRPFMGARRQARIDELCDSEWTKTARRGGRHFDYC